jgi:plasmid stability protein
MAGTALMIRNLGRALKARLVAYAAARGLGTSAAAVELLERGLDNVDAVAAGGHARAATLTPEQRSAQARHASTSRWRNR